MQDQEDEGDDECKLVYSTAQHRFFLHMGGEVNLKALSALFLLIDCKQVMVRNECLKGRINEHLLG